MSRTTLAPMWRDLMDAPSVETRVCAICGRAWPLNRHHMVPRSAGELYEGGAKRRKPTIMLCGSGNASGCHGLAHSHRLHFDYRDGALVYLITETPVKRLEALSEPGWHEVPLGY